MKQKSNFELMSTFLTEVWTHGNEDAIFHEFEGVATGLWPDEEGIDPEGFLQYYRAVSPLVNDLRFEFTSWHEKEDRLWLSWIVHGKHWKNSERLLQWPGAASTRFRDGKLVECNNYQDFMILFSQLDLVPEQAFEYGLAGADLLETEARKKEALPPSAHGRSHFLWPGLRKVSSAGRDLYLPCSPEELQVVERKGFSLPTQEQLEILFESATFSMVVVDHTDKILETDQAFANLIERLPEGLPGLLFYQLLVPEDQQAEQTLFSELVSGKRTQYRHRARLMRGRSSFWVHLSVARVPSTGGGTRIVRAVHETRRIEEMVAFQETERKALSADLHDALARELATLWLYIQTGRHSLEPTQILIDRCLEVVNKMNSELRSRMKALRNPVLDGTPLSAALQSLLERAGRESKTRFFLSCLGDIDGMPHTAALLTYRVVQEATRNVIEQAEAGNCRVRVERQTDVLWGEVVDDGRGFELEEALAAGGIGLTGMRQRCELMGGRFEVKSEPGRGTTVRFEITLAAKPE